MEGGGGETSSSLTGAGGAMTGGTLLPWHLIPEFRPGETDINDYARRMTFLSGIWPKEHMTLLAPRAALCCQGSAFQKVVRLSPEKLKTTTDAGVRLLVETLGGVWGKTTLENRFERFERAIYTTSQRADETHESYMARHEVQFEDLLAQGVTLSDIRAYILLRNSGLSAEDKRRVIVEAEGDVTYAKVTKSLKLLGSKFFEEVQTGSKGGTRNKTYDINYTQEDQDAEWVPDAEDTIYMASTGFDDATLEALQAEGDEDALVIQQFEDQVLEVLQNDPEVSSCFNVYLEARKKLTEKAKFRGFWKVGRKEREKEKANHGPIDAVWNNASPPADARSATRLATGRQNVHPGRRTTLPTVQHPHLQEWSLCRRMIQVMIMSHPWMLSLSLSRTFQGSLGVRIITVQGDPRGRLEIKIG